LFYSHTATLSFFKRCGAKKLQDIKIHRNRISMLEETHYNMCEGDRDMILPKALAILVILLGDRRLTIFHCTVVLKVAMSTLMIHH
jgi:hypothetical protein